MIRRLSFAALAFWLAAPAHGDAIVVNQSLFAETIAEYYVEDDHVRLELEIGPGDLGAFRNLLPDALYQQLGFGNEPLRERIFRFTGEDMPVVVGGVPLEGRVTDIGPGVRPLRDSVTGEELPTPEDEATAVVRATVVYAFGDRPDALTLTAPAATGIASIGFVLYHKGVAVNDFRYLASGFTVNLDWEDPWYSAFLRTSLRRQYDAAMTGFIYVEPFEVRKEIIVRPSDMQRYVDLGLEGELVIPAERHADIKDKVVAFLEDYFPLAIDGQPVEGRLDRVNFLKRTLRSSVVVDNQDIDLLPATLGVIYTYPTDGLPEVVEMEWNLFDERTQRVPASAVDQAGPLPTILMPEYPVLKWENFLQDPELPTLAELALPPSALQRASSWARWLFLGLTAIFLIALARAVRADNGRVRHFTSLALSSAALAMLSFYQYQQVQLDGERLQQLVGDLLHNVYRAFDYRDEETIYDALSHSVSGELLTDIYLETRQGLELANQGGARVRVKSTDVLRAELEDRAANQLVINSEWNVSGSVGHWGHVHQRTNRYLANLEISEVDGAWKLTGLEILDEQRL